MRIKRLTIVTIVAIALIVGACSENNNLTSIDENFTADHDMMNVEDNNNSEYELLALPPLPEVYTLPFEPLQLEQLISTTMNDDWVHIQTWPFGRVDGTNMMLNIYEETIDHESRYHGVLERGGNKFIIYDVSTSLIADSTTCDEVCVYEQYFSGQDRFELIGAIELWSNGPGHYIFVVHDVVDDVLLTFSMWGKASFMDLDVDGHDEFVIEFPGLHLNLPDVAIIRARDGNLEVVASVGQQLRMIEMNRDYAMLKKDGQQPVIHISNMQLFSEQLYEEQSADYAYDDGKLRMVSQFDR